jgi:hypothetical protein
MNAVNPSKCNVVLFAAKACKSFAESSACFLNRPGRAYGGWENWLTVEITRLLNNPCVIPFCGYPCGDAKIRTNLDIYIERPVPIAVEIKVNYITNEEIRNWGPKIEFPDRILDDGRKLDKLDHKTVKLLLVSTCFDSSEGLDKYLSCMERTLGKRFESLQHHSWYNCSAGTGHNLLLALSSTPGLPRSRR